MLFPTASTVTIIATAANAIIMVYTHATIKAVIIACISKPGWSGILRSGRQAVGCVARYGGHGKNMVCEGRKERKEDKSDAKINLVSGSRVNRLTQLHWLTSMYTYP